MTAFLVVLVIILFGVTVWQMNKIFNMSKTANDLGDSSEIANNKDNNINGWLMLGLAIFTYGLLIICFWEWGDVLLPRAASEHGADIDNLMLISMSLIFVVGFFTLWLFIYGLFTWTEIMNIDEDNEDAMVVELYAYQFDWRARYAGADNTLGEANVRLIEGVNQLGVDAADPNAQDDVVVNELHLPVGKEIIFKMRSQDVLHSAYMPHFRAQMNCVPGMITQFAFTPSITTEEMRQDSDVKAKVQRINNIRKDNSVELVQNGEDPLEPYEFDFLLLCNKICGTNHYNMQMKIIVESQEDFDLWLAAQPNLGTTLK